MYRRTYIPHTASTNSGSTFKRHARQPWRLCTLIGLVVWMCVIWIMVDAWLVEKYVVGTRVAPPVTTTNAKESSSWSHLVFYAANDEEIKQPLQTVSGSKENIQSANTCEMPIFDTKSKHSEFGTCKRRQPIEGSCEQIEKLIHSKPKSTCNHQRTLTICQLQQDHVKCDGDVCKFGISIGLINSNTGAQLSWKTAANITSLEDTIENLLKKNSSGGNYGFCFLKCNPARGYNPIGTQLLLLPQHFTPNACNDKTCQDAVDINVIWLDSTSHSHFFRSLPQSINALRDAKKNELFHVFNYDLMQSMDGGTFINAMALTRGNKNDGVGNFFKQFQDGGYHVTYLDDLCWTDMLKNRVIGIPLLFGMKHYEYYGNITKSWRDMHEVLAAKGVDQIGVTLANCDTITGYKNIFLERAIEPKCYNGKFYTDYIFTYMQSLQTNLQQVRKPFLNYLDLNTCHEPSGRRCQSLDDSLANFITHISKQKNTLTFLFGDHGLKYGPILKATREAYYEAAHPVCFIMASKDLDAKLGKEKIDALRENQDRLIDIIDIRQTIYTLSPVKDGYSFQIEKNYDNHPNGLFYPINPNRSCKTLGIKLESGKCVCDEGQPSQKTKNGSRVNMLTEFALGEINNIIQEQFMSLNRNHTLGFGSCQRLVGKWIDNVHERVLDNVTTTEMEIYLPAGSNAPQTEDSFYVIVQVTSNSTETSIELVYHLRTSSHGVYDECRDNGVDRKLCICSPSNRSTLTRQWHLQAPKVFGTATTVVSLNRHLFIYERRTSDGIVLEASCDDHQHITSTYKVLLLTNNKTNVVSSKDLPLTVIVKSGMKVFLDVFYQLDSSKKWELEYEVSYRQLA
ncbi:uncharacterized protein [Amphiura filiformis]|uniref:uncharacterized protein n=1 Tax=Amphiura filiformis TaxID=82378 RepID=UPI003B218F99